MNKSVVILKGKTRHGKNRIAQHGSKWFVEKVDKFRGQPAMLLRSENETFAIRGRGNSKQEWKTTLMQVHTEADVNGIVIRYLLKID